MGANLVSTDPTGDERKVDLNGQTFRIGRLEENELSIDNPYISRIHAEISYDGSAYSIRDLESTSGTFVNDAKVKQRVLRDGDKVRLGRGRGVEFIFKDGPKPSTKEMESLRPLRVIAPDDTRFINTAKLVHSGKLADRTIEWLRALYESTNDILLSHSPVELSERLSAFLSRILKADRCAVMLSDFDKDTLEVVASVPAGRPISPSSSVTSQVYNENVAILSTDARTDARFQKGESVQLQAIRSVMCAPVGSKTRLWGVCYVDNLTTDRAFDEEELEFLAAVARQAGLAMENIYLLEEQRKSLESFMHTLAASLNARDDSTAGHSARVGALAAGIARTMGLAPADVRLVYYAGLLHDYGKIGIRDDVLLKPAELTEEEYEHVKEHPLHTFKLLSKIRFPQDLADIPFVAAAHHERWNGSGYPHGLKGEEIPIGSRIVAVADAYDALTEERCYHEAWTAERALVELTMRSGLYFDPMVMEAFVQFFSREIGPRKTREAETLTSMPAVVVEKQG